MPWACSRHLSGIREPGIGVRQRLGDPRDSGYQVTRRNALNAGATLLSGLAIADAFNGAEAAALRRFEGQTTVDPKHRILPRGGTIISLDNRIGDLVRGDVLIEGKRIAAIAPELKVADAQVIEAQDTIIIPGLVDSHRHSWEAQLRRINPNSPTLADYSNATHLSFAKAYRPEDMYIGNFLTAIGCIDAGITCLIDNSQNARSADHSDAAVEALMDSGVRAVHASGAPLAGDWAKQWPHDLERLQKKYFSSADQLVTLRMFSGPNRENWAAARKFGLRITTEFTGAKMAKLVESMGAENLVDNTFNHCGGLPESTWKMLVDSGANVNVCPRSDAQYGLV